MLCPDIYSPGNSKTSQRHGKGNKGFDPRPPKKDLHDFDTPKLAPIPSASGFGMACGYLNTF